MQALGVTVEDGGLYWRGRRIIKLRVIREFIRLEEVQKIFPFLIRAQELDLILDSVDYDCDDDGHLIKLMYRDTHKILTVKYIMSYDGSEYFICGIRGRITADGDKFDKMKDIKPLIACLDDLAKNKRQVAEMAEQISSLKARVAELEADIAERKLRPPMFRGAKHKGGEDYEAARARFNEQAYE